MDLLVIGVASLGIFAASFFATVSGSGYALIAMPILSTVLPVKAAIILVIVTVIILRSVTMYKVRKQFEWNTVLTTTFGSFLGTIPGSYTLKVMPITYLQIFLGTVLLVATVLMGRQYSIKIKNKTLGRLGAGFLSGFFGSSTSISGPPIMIYFLNEKVDKDIMRANMIWFFGIGGVSLFLSNYLSGNVAAVTDWNILLSITPAMFLGIYLGEKFFMYLNQELFRKLSLLIICAGAVMMLVNGVRGMM